GANISLGDNVDLTGSSLQQLTLRSSGNYTDGGKTLTLGTTNLFIDVDLSLNAGTIIGANRTITLSGNAVTTNGTITNTNGSLTILANTFNLSPFNVTTGTLSLGPKDVTTLITVGGNGST